MYSKVIFEQNQRYHAKICFGQSQPYKEYLINSFKNISY